MTTSHPTLPSPADLRHLPPSANLYFLGIGGTGMATVAGLCQEAGFKVRGSDAGVYPPMSNMLADLGITVRTPYSPANLDGPRPDLVVVANVLSRGHAELEHALSLGLPYTSFPALLGAVFLEQRVSCVVAGTHGKTTTASLLSHVLFELGEDPSFMVGGIPRNFPRSFRLGQGPAFVIEGDEYDTAFFDKGPKFLHYRPKHLILNNLEFDHADIYPNLEAIAAQFRQLTTLVDAPERIIANVDDPGISNLINDLGLKSQVTRVATLGTTANAAVSVRDYRAEPGKSGGQKWAARLQSDHLGEFWVETQLSGRHNLANIAQIVACLVSMERAGHLRQPLTADAIARAIATFKAPMRRLDLLASHNDIDIFEDFAHHPTAVRLVIEGLRTVYPERRLLVAFEPRSASNRRNVFQAEYAKTLALADRIYIGECMVDKRIPDSDRFDPVRLSLDIGAKAKNFATNADLLTTLGDEVRPGDTVVFMSSGSFSGIQYQLANRIHPGADESLRAPGPKV